MSVLATSATPALQIVGAISAAISALLLAWVALRAQSAKQQIEDIRKVIEKELHDQLDAETRGLIIGQWVKRAVREVLGEDPRNRRWYDQE